MANGVFTFRPEFKEFLPSYRYVVRVWIGDGVETGTSGVLYAEYEDGSIAELGSVSLYAIAAAKGYEGTEEQWLQMIMGVADLVKGAEAHVSYMVSESGVEHPDPENEGWSDTPSFEKGKFTWSKVDLKWIDGTTTTFYSAAYQGKDGSVTSVNGQTGDITLHGANIPIAEEDDKSIKEYIDQSVIPEIATEQDIDSLFTMVFFNGAIFINGRPFVDGDYVTLQIEAVTPGAPMPEEHTVTVRPTEGFSWRYSFGPLAFTPADLEDQERKTFEYRITEIENGISGTPASEDVYLSTMTLIAYGDGMMRIEKAENWNALHFTHDYTASGSIQFGGTMILNGRSMLAHEFAIELSENGTPIQSDISTTVEVESGEEAAIAYPTIFYRLEDVGVHTYTVRQTNPSKNGVVISDVVYTVTVNVTDRIRDGELEIIPSENWQSLNYVNTYTSSGSTVFEGTTTILNRKFVSKDTYQLTVTGSGKLPSPAVLDVTLPAGETSVDFAFNTLTYTLEDMLDANLKYLPTKTFVYSVTESGLLPGTSDDELTHTITVKVTDDRKGHLLIEQTYSDDPLRNLKYHLIITIAFVTRYCIEGGLPMGKAYNLSDIYIQRVDKCGSEDEVNAIHREVIDTYVHSMYRLHNSRTFSRAVMTCIDYIYDNLHSKITLDDLADMTGLSAPYLSKLFHKETGVTVKQYILRKKVEAAENLLKFSDQPCSAISHYLGFGTESHFISVFKSCTKITPKEYRERFFRSRWGDKNEQ